MRVLFLDMDGVVNSSDFFEVFSKTQYRKARGIAKAKGRLNNTFVDMIDPKVVTLLNQIIESCNCSVVSSSSWRTIFTPKEITLMLKEKGFKGEIIDRTPDLMCERGDEILEWLNKHPEVKSFVILDDGDDMGKLLPRLVQTTFQKGLQLEHVRKVFDLFDGDVK